MGVLRVIFYVTLFWFLKGILSFACRFLLGPNSPKPKVDEDVIETNDYSIKEI